MSRYPFNDYASEFMETMRGVYADETWRTKERRYRRMAVDVNRLKEEKMISTTSPKLMTVEDVRVYLIQHKERVGPTDMAHEVTALKKLCTYTGNPAVDRCLVMYPGIKPAVRSNGRHPPMEDEMYNRILHRSESVGAEDWELLRAYALVLICLRSGTRNKEVRFMNVDDIDTQNWVMHIIHVKGEASYGQPRIVPIHPDIRPVLAKYLLLRKSWSSKNQVASRALFPSKQSEDGYLSGNGIRRIKSKVEEDLDIRFDLRKCRRTFGQKYLDDGLDLESTSVLMGHSSTKTTEGFYCRKKLVMAIDNARNVW